MNNYPDFSNHGYQAIRELGRNREAGRITYLATCLTSNQQVVIKEWRFADASADWSSFKAYQREIEVLQQLEHPRIPHYLGSFETPQGFCLVQEYKNAPSLAERHSFEPDDIQQIAFSILEILVYLQRRVPPIIHRDIKPENILVDHGKAPTAYLVDFGLARIRSGEVAVSSVAAGTPGFMPPEEQFGRPLSSASDLYSLGATLICLLTGTRSIDVGQLIDENYRFDFKSKVPQLSPRFVAWLTKMVEPNLKQRYADAATALSDLKTISVGSTIKHDTPVRTIKLRKPAIVFSLVTIGTVAVLGAKSMINQQPKSIISQPNSLVSQLLATKECAECNLQKADLRKAKLKDANLEGANLRGADLRDAKLKGANLGKAQMEMVNLKDADLKNANLEGANLEGANLEDANLKKANLKGANLNGTNLKDAKLEGAIMPDGTKNRSDSDS